MNKHFATFLIPVLLIVSCATSRLSTFVELKDLPVPPGTKKIADNLYFDQMEIRNIDYLEYLRWTENVYGINSDEYKQAVPDNTIWAKTDMTFASLDTLFSTGREFRLLSVLGVSNRQAKEFSRWRSDRVMEFMLIRYKVLKWDPKPTKETAFTTAKYFSGNFHNLQPSPYLQYYPLYSLLDSTENTETGFKTVCLYKKWE